MLSGISIWQLLIILVIIMLLFGTKKLRNVGKDLGGAVKGFKDAVKEGEDAQTQEQKQVEQKDESVVSTQETTETKDKDQA